MKKIFAVIGVLLFSFGCHIINPPDEPQPPQYYQLQGVISDASTGAKIKNVVVRFDGNNTTTNRHGVYRFKNIIEGDNKPLRVVAESLNYAPFIVRINFHGNTQYNIRLTYDGPEWDFENTKLMGWSDPVSGAYYYPEKADAIDVDIASNGSNCGVVNVNRSNGTQFHAGNCADNLGWWRKIKDKGYRYQFCKRNADGDWDTSHAHFPYENVHDSEELSVAWLNQMEARVKSLHDTGQWALVNLWCPYDNKWFGINWYYWTNECDESPFTVGPNSRWYHPKQKVATQALLNRIKNYPNVIILDNWEIAWDGSTVDLAWKKLCFEWVQEIMPGVPYFAYIGDESQVAEKIAWINSEPRISGVNTHYMLFDDVRNFFGLHPNKRVLHTEEMDLNAPATFRAIEWCLTNDDETCMYYGNYRDYMRGDGGPDVDKGVRDEWNPKIKALLQ